MGLPLHSAKFIKSERLCSKKLAGLLFQSGKFINHPLFRFVYLPVPRTHSEYHQALFSVPRKLFRKAVDRNKIRRLFREAYRQNKALLYKNEQRTFSYLIGYVYISKNIPAYHELEQQILASIRYLEKYNP